MSSTKTLGYMPLTEPTVPTGIKIGVCICPWSVVMIPHLADEPGSVAVSLNVMYLVII